MTRHAARALVALALCMLPVGPASAAPAAASNGEEDRLDARGAMLIRTGERVTIRLDADMRPTVQAVETLDRLASQSLSPAPKPGVVILTLWQEDGGAARLTVANGTGLAFAYPATEIITMASGKLGGRATSVCTVAPGTSNLEQWQETLVGLELGPFFRTAADHHECRAFEAPAPAVSN